MTTPVISLITVHEGRLGQLAYDLGTLGKQIWETEEAERNARDAATRQMALHRLESLYAQREHVKTEMERTEARLSHMRSAQRPSAPRPATGSLEYHDPFRDGMPI